MCVLRTVTVPLDASVLDLWLDSGKEAVPDIITRRDNPFLKEKEEVSDEGKEVEAVPNKQRDDLARRRAQSRPLPQRDAQMSFVTSSMSQADVQRWERLKMTEPRCPTHALSLSTCSAVGFKAGERECVCLRLSVQWLLLLVWFWANLCRILCSYVKLVGCFFSKSTSTKLRNLSDWKSCSFTYFVQIEINNAFFHW